jgi:hypothetical protein
MTAYTGPESTALVFTGDVIAGPGRWGYLMTW